MNGVLVDTQLWVAHLARPDRRLRRLAESGLVVVHPYVLCELALGDLGPRRAAFLAGLEAAPRAPEVGAGDVYRLVERERLERSGIGYVDAALLASAAEDNLRLWTDDRALRAAAARLGLLWLFRRH